MFVVGTESNVALAREMGTSKTPNQVGGAKLRILKKYPDWKSTFSYLNPDNSPSSDSTPSDSSDEESNEQASPPRSVPEREDIEIIVLEEGAAQTIVVEEGATQVEPTGSQGEVVTIVIAYPLQVALECPHCCMKWVGDALEGYIEHLSSSHSNFTYSYMFVCALCAAHTDTEHEVLQHLVNEHIPDLATLPISTIKQGKNTLLPLLEGTTENGGDGLTSTHPTSPPLSDEEEVPPLPPPLPCMREFMTPSKDQPQTPPLPDTPVPDVGPPSTPSQLYSPISDAPLPVSPRSPATVNNEPALPPESTSPQPPPPGIRRHPSGGRDKDKEAEERKRKLQCRVAVIV